MSDELDSWANRYRPPGGLAPAPASPAVFGPIEETPEYRAWGRGHPESAMLDVRQRPETGISGQGELLPLNYLLRVTYMDSPIAGDMVTLAFADCLITARGRNLTGLRADLVAGKVDFLEEFDGARWPAPPAGSPVILAIEIVAPGRSKA